jgi:hypothetical protein
METVQAYATFDTTEAPDFVGALSIKVVGISQDGARLFETRVNASVSH